MSARLCLYLLFVCLFVCFIIVMFNVHVSHIPLIRAGDGERRVMEGCGDGRLRMYSSPCAPTRKDGENCQPPPEQ